MRVQRWNLSRQTSLENVPRLPGASMPITPRNALIAGAVTPIKAERKMNLPNSRLTVIQSQVRDRYTFSFDLLKEVNRQKWILRACVVGLFSILAITFLFQLANDYKIVQVEQYVNKSEKKIAAEFQRERERLNYVATMLNGIRTYINDLKRPTDPFEEGQVLFRDGRYIDAEAAFARYVAERPAGRFAPEALFYAGLSAMSRQRCEIAAAHFSRLIGRFPEHDLTLKARKNIAFCHKAGKGSQGG